jgi:small subunit ribosomal protein S2
MDQQTTTVTPELASEMIKVGVILGHTKAKTHPKMKPFIAGNRNEIELLSPEAVMESLDLAIAFLRGVLMKSGLVLAVGTTLPAKQGISEFAKEFSFPFVTVRWLGGTLTNFKVITGRLRYFEDLKVKREKGELQKYTKREQLEFDKEIGQMSKIFTGLQNLSRMPSAIFVVDAHEHSAAVREAKRLGIPVVAIMDSDDDPNTVEYPIIASDHAKSSIEWILNRVREGIRGVTPVADVKVSTPAAEKK